MGVTINNKSTTTEPPPSNGQQPKPPGAQMHFTGTESSPSMLLLFTYKEMFSSHGRLLTIAMYPHGEVL